MKQRFYFFFTGLLLLQPLVSQGQNRDLLFDSKANAVRWEFGTGLLFSEIATQWVASPEFVVGSLIKNRWSVGFRAAFPSVREARTRESRNQLVPWRTEVSFHQGLAYLGYIFQPESVIHFRTELGLGIAQWSQRRENLEGMVQSSTTLFALVQPRVGVELNCTKWLSIGGWLGTQWQSADGEGIQLDSPHAMIGIRIGNLSD